MELINFQRKNVTVNDDENFVDVFSVNGCVAVFSNGEREKLKQAVEKAVDTAVKFEKEHQYRFEVIVDVELKKMNLRSNCSVLSISMSRISKETAIAQSLISEKESDCDKEK